MELGARQQASMIHEATLIGAPQPTHREFDVAVRQLTPAFDAAHIGLLGIANEEIACLAPRFVARQGERLPQKTIVMLAPASHPVGEIARARDHVATPTNTDWVNIALPSAKPSPALPPGTPGIKRGIESPPRHKADRLRQLPAPSA